MSTADNGLGLSTAVFAGRMSELMQSTGTSFRTLSGRVHADAGYLNKVAKGRRPVPPPDMVDAIDTALGAGGELIALARLDTARIPTPPAALGDADAERVRQTLLHIVALDTLHGSDGLVPLAVRTFRNAADRLAVVGGSADVQSAVSDLGAAAAWVTADAVERDLSRTIALEALALADMAGDTRMHWFLLSHLSMVNEHAGRYAEALGFAQRALAEGSADPRVQAMFRLRQARALSGLGRVDDALKSWDHAEHLLTRSTITNDGLTYWIHDSEMAIHKAVILNRGHSRDAVDWARRGVEWLPDAQGRDQVLFRTMLLYGAVLAHAWSEVPGIVGELLEYDGVGRSARVPDELGKTWALIEQARAPKAARDAVRAALDAFPSAAA